MTATEPTAVPKPLYVGATTCDFAPAWVHGADTDIGALVRAAFAADPDELTPQLMLADALLEAGDPRERWVRAGVAMWSAAGALKAGKRTWDYDKCRKVLGPVCESVAGWRVAGLWGCLVAWHGPAGDGSGRVMGRTWADERVRVVQRSLWFWGLGLLNENPLDDDAAWSQAYAAWSQADAAGSQAYAAGRQAYAAGRQADAAGSQAYAAGRQADAWRFSRSVWEKICAPVLKKLAVLEVA